MGKSLRTRSTSSDSSRRSITRAMASTLPLRSWSLLRALERLVDLLLERELLADPFVPLHLEFLGQLRSSRLHDASTDHHVDVFGGDVVQDSLVVGDDEHPELR